MEYRLIKNDQQNISIIERILTNRGLPLAQIDHYLHTTDSDILDPLLLDNMNEGAKLLVSAVKDKKKILIIVDSDCDGYTSAALLYNYLIKLFPSMTSNITYVLHEGKVHGIVLDEVPADVGLVIVPDAGSNNLDEHKALQERGCDVLVLDHHECDNISSNACIINNQLSSKYSDKAMSGVGIVYKFCAYLDSLLNIILSNNYLDLVALGMIADMSDLKDFEVRHLIQLGLKHIVNPFFYAMIEKQDYSLKGERTPIGIAFYIAPYINAMVRSGTPEEKKVMFEAMLENHANISVPSTKRGHKIGDTEKLVDQAVRICMNVKSRQKKNKDTMTEVIKDIIEKDDLNKWKILLVPIEGEMDKNLTGLIANELMAEYGKPVLLVSRKSDDPDMWGGSGRNCANSKIEDLRLFLRDSGFFTLVEGHSSAFGIEIPDNNIEAFRSWSQGALKDIDFSPCYRVDAIIKGDELKNSDVLAVASLKEFWGQGLEEAKIAIEGFKINGNNVTLLSEDKNPTIKISLPTGLNVMKFKASKEEYEQLSNKYGCVIVNMIVKCDINIWRQEAYPQLLIEDYEIVSKLAFDF